jgi:hypothetical protein
LLSCIKHFHIFSPSIFIVILVSTPFDSIPLKSVCREPSDGSHPNQSLHSIGSIIVLIVTLIWGRSRRWTSNPFDTALSALFVRSGPLALPYPLAVFSIVGYTNPNRLQRCNHILIRVIALDQPFSAISMTDFSGCNQVINSNIEYSLVCCLAVLFLVFFLEKY